LATIGADHRSPVGLRQSLAVSLHPSATVNLVHLAKLFGGNPADSAHEQNEHELFSKSGKDDIF
jgi:hypothetical protein